MRHKNLPLLAGAIMLMLTGSPALADPVETDGSAAAEVVEPSRVRHISDLRFGAFASPATNSTLRISTDGTVTPTGGVTATMNVPQPAEGRGPAQFTIERSGGRPKFLVLYPLQIDITNGTSTMAVTKLNSRIVRTGNAGREKEYRLDIGGTLNIDADQEAGSYAGDFIVTVLFL